MAKLADLIVSIGANTREFNAELRKLERRISNTSDAIMGMGKGLTMSLTLPVAGLGAAAVKAASDLQSMEVQFRSLTGGADQAAQMVKRLNEFAAKTPYEIEGISSAARQLLASGTDIEQVTEQLQYLGDIAASQGVPIEEIAAIFSKVQAKGKVELESLNQLAERGIPIFKALSEATGLPADALGAGAVSVEEFTATLRGMAQEGGMAYMAMDNLSQTAAGKFSTAMDSLKMAAASIGELLLPYITAAIDKVTEMADKFQALDEGTKKMILTIAGVVAAIGPLVMGFSAATKAYKAFTGANEMIIKLFPKLSAAMGANPVGLAALAIAGAVALIIAYWDEIVAYFTTGSGAGVWSELQATIEAVMDYVMEVWAHAVDFLTLFWDKFGGNIMATIDTAMDNIMGIIKGALGFIKGIIKAGTAAMKGDWRGVLNGMLDASISIFQMITNTILGALRNIGNALDMALNALGISSNVGGWLEGIQSSVTSFFDSMKSDAGEAKKEVDDVVASMESIGETKPAPKPVTRAVRRAVGGGAAGAGASAAAVEFGTTLEQVLEPIVPHSQRIADHIASLPDTLNLQEIAEDLDIVADDMTFDQVLFDKFQKARQAAIDWQLAVKETMLNLQADMVAIGGSFGAAFGEVLMGTKDGEEALKQFASQAIDAGFQAATALAITAAGQSSLASGPGAAFVLPILITAGMALMRSVFQGITGFADGGIVSGPTMGLVGEYPGAKSNPEVIAPLSKLKSLLADTAGGGHIVVTGRISGRDILISNERAMREGTRYR